MTSASLVVLFCVLYVHIGVSINPGFKARITNGGFNLANQIAVGILSSKVNGAPITDESGKAHHVHYTLSRMSVTQFVTPQSSITLNPPQGLSWKVNAPSLIVNGHWKYKVKAGKWKVVSDSGKFEIKVLRMSFSLGIVISAASGRPTISVTGCNCDIGSVHLTIHGGAAKFYDLFKKTVENDIKKKLQKKLCDVANDAINKNAEQALAKLKVTVGLGKTFLLDYSLLSKPVFQKNYMETYHKGEVFWKPSKSEAPFQAPPFPAMNVTQKMLYFWLSDYIFNTLAFQAQNHGFLAYNVTTKNLPATGTSYLNTTCTTGKCIGTLIPKIGQMYPNKQVELRLSSSAVPNMSVTNYIQAACQGNISMYVPLSNNKSAHLLTLNATMRTAVNLSISEQKIFANVGNVNIQMTVINSSVGSIGKLTLLFLQTILSGFVQTEMNDKGKSGFPLPVTDNIGLINSQIILVKDIVQLHQKKDSVIIATDVKYKPGMEYLKFEQVPKMRWPGYSYRHMRL